MLCTKQHRFTTSIGATSPPLSFLFSGGGRDGHTSVLPHSCSLSLAFFLFPLRKQRSLTDPTPKPCLTSIFSLVTVECLYLSSSAMFLGTGPELPGGAHFHEDTEHRDTVRTLNGVHRDPVEPLPCFYKLRTLPKKTFPGWVCSYVMMNITLYLQTKVTVIYTYTIGTVNYFQSLHFQLCPSYYGNL